MVLIKRINNFMNFEEWYKKYDDYNCTTEDFPKVAKDGWIACKEEVLRIIFLNTKVNGVHKVDVEKVISEIEKL